MPDLATERRHLAKAVTDVEEGEARIERQALLVARLRAEGHDTALAESLLRSLEGTLGGWKDHRDEILRTIARLEREAGGGSP